MTNGLDWLGNDMKYADEDTRVNPWITWRRLMQCQMKKGARFDEQIARRQESLDPQKQN